LGDAEVLDELIGGVGEALGTLATKLGGEVLEGGIKARVRVVFGEVGEQFLAESVGLLCGFSRHGDLLSVG
jgi:hypothetical protein